jgi:hypothetical protein
MKVANLDAAAYCMTVRHPFRGAYPVPHSSRVEFEFLDRHDKPVQESLTEFFNDEPVPAKSYAESMRQLKSILRDSRQNTINNGNQQYVRTK